MAGVAIPARSQNSLVGGRPVNAPGWVQGVLQGIGAPITQTNSDALQLWAKAEGMAAGSNNWLATTMPGGTPLAGNSAGVQAYPDQATGVAATVATIKGDPGIVNAFQQNGSLAQIWSAINKSSWCAGCTGGTYPATFGIGTRTAAGGQNSVAIPATLTAATTGGGGCGAKGNVFTSPKALIVAGPSISITWCQAKAMTGSFFMIAGGAVAIIGVSLIAIAGLGKAPGPIGMAAGFVTGRKSASRGPSSSEMEASPTRRGSASSRIPKRSVSADELDESGNPQESF